MEKQTSLSADRLAKPSRSPENAKASWMSEVSSCSNTSELFEELNPLTASGKTSPVSCRRTEDGHLLPSKGNWKTAGMRSRGECWTRNLPEWPSDAAVSFLSDVLIRKTRRSGTLEPDCLRGDHPSSREKRAQLARAARNGACKTSGDGASDQVGTYSLAANTIGRKPKNGGNGTGYSEGSATRSPQPTSTASALRRGRSTRGTIKRRASTMRRASPRRSPRTPQEATKAEPCRSRFRLHPENPQRMRRRREGRARAGRRKRHARHAPRPDAFPIEGAKPIRDPRSGVQRLPLPRQRRHAQHRAR